MNYNPANQREINEAISAGERSLASLGQAKEELRKARNLGIWDMLGGRGLVTFLKQTHIRDAQSSIERARYELQCFSHTLNDVNSFSGIDLGISDFLIFADYFFDGIIADFMVQQKINQAADNVDEAIRRVNNILYRLKNM